MESPVSPAFGRPYAAAGARSFLASVYRWMSLGLAATGLTAWYVSETPALWHSIVRGPLFIGLIVAELALVFAFSGLVHRIRASTAAAMFFAYAVLNGLTLSVVFLAYTRASVATTFFVTAGTFAGMSAFGALTKRDLSSWSSFLMMGLWGLILGGLVNMFLGSPMLYWGLTFAGVITFTGLAAYDTQRIQEIGRLASGEEEGRKLALQGALALYLDFVNLFLYLLRLFGDRRR